VTRAWLVGVVLLGAACAEAPKLETGDRCTLTSECASPLVCRLERCRRECSTMRDCPIGSSCVRDARGFGACQVMEDECTLASECAAPLVCRFGTCTNPCATAEDCPAGAVCINDPDEGGTACVDPSERECERNSDCVAPQICAVDFRCREECREDRDCRDGLMCLGMGAMTFCGRPGVDAGIDAGPDAGLDGGTDAGPLDAGPLDAGPDVGRMMDAGMDGGPLDGGPLDTGPPDTGPPDTGPPDGGMMTMLGRGLVHVALGSLHGCRVSAVGRMDCWGDNPQGQIGDGTMMRRTSPVLVRATGVIEANGGGGHGCLLDDTMSLWCWGQNDSGQVGDGTTMRRLSPVMLTLPFTPRRVEAGGENTCAIDTTGAVWCWGNNTHGQIGDGTMVTPRLMPRMVTLPMAAAQVAIGGSSLGGTHTCALLVDGTVRCWGDDFYGQLGNGAPASDSSVPVVVSGVSGIEEIVTGSHHTCARRSTGAVVCWGDDGFGQGGDGTLSMPEFVYAPAGDVVGLGDAVELGAGVNHTCARRMGGTIVCWGSNVDGQVGLDPRLMINRYATPQTVTGLTGALELGVGDHHGCVRRALDHRCWGQGRGGQLGDGLMTDSWNHVRVSP
jgi:hypothetical protein